MKSFINNFDQTKSYHISFFSNLLSYKFTTKSELFRSLKLNSPQQHSSIPPYFYVMNLLITFLISARISNRWIITRAKRSVWPNLDSCLNCLFIQKILASHKNEWFDSDRDLNLPSKIQNFIFPQVIMINGRACRQYWSFLETITKESCNARVFNWIFKPRNSTSIDVKTELEKSHKVLWSHWSIASISYCSTCYTISFHRHSRSFTPLLPSRECVKG